MDRPLTFFIIAGIVIVLFLHYSGSSFFPGEGPLATGPGGGLNEPPSPLSFNGSASGAPTGTQPSMPGQSFYRDEVTISRAFPSPADLRNEQLIIKRSGFTASENEKKQPISLDGWTIENRKGDRIQIPSAFYIPNNSVSATPIELRGGGEIIVITGDTTFGSSFQENTCTGYFNEFHSFIPPLSEACPEIERSELLKTGLNSSCIDLIERTPRCRQTKIGFEEQAAGNACIDFVKQHLNYAGCLRDNREKQNFFTNRWRVFLKRKEPLWDPRHDNIILRDKAGLIVNEYSY
ncbi:MAG: hypothetical protein HYW90_03445 [Candidatus Sungbacteria bacterium]|nr:hypothetical protein [Candidatus Sungbacteria bacterium]